MEQSNPGKTGLPENAYTELKPGESYRPILAADLNFPEITPWSIIWGILMAILFTAAVAYSSLKIGQAMEAAIPIAIIAVGVASAFKKKNTLGQNVIIQSIGASSGVIVAGAAFTIPALYILKLDVSFIQIFFSSLFGGALGILFLIPFRKYFVKEMHGKFPFPEATATTEILVTGEKGGSQARLLIVSGLIGGIYDFFFSSLHVWKEVITTKILPYGQELADKAKLICQLNVSALVVSFGYLIGLRYAAIITFGSLLSWFVLVPLVNQIGVIASSGGPGFFGDMSAGEIFTDYVRLIGIGGIAMSGIIGIIKSYKVIGRAFSLAFNGIFGGKQATAVVEERTQRDMNMSTVVLMLFLALVGAFLFILLGVQVTLLQAIISILIVLIISFLFTTVAANAIAIVGSNPVSGMTLMTLIISSIILVRAGLTGNQGIVSAMLIGGIVCTALSMAGGFVTDLKIGYWIGSSPYKQERFKFLGVIVSAAMVGVVIFILNDTYGFTSTIQMKNSEYKEYVSKFPQAQAMLTPFAKYDADSALTFDWLQVKTLRDSMDKKAYKSLMEYKSSPMEAPQANAMAAVIEPLMSPNAKVDWMLYLVGAIIALIINWLGIPPLAFALGMYLPLHLNTPLIVGGLVAHFISKSSKDEKLVTARNQQGTLIASGFMAGAAIFGVIGAFLIFFNIFGKEFNLVDTLFGTIGWGKSWGSEFLGFVMFALLMVYFVWETLRAKKED